ncbi:hypothetical protein [Streptomyces olivaceus]|uniref:hypothetical protein n=1 Tax=Streptomyces olivaceus TaxID=47716 RepID=UPI0036A64823
MPRSSQTPLDFSPFDDELSGKDGMGCHCSLCNDLKYAHGRHDYLLPYSAALHAALVAGTHVHVSWGEWTEKLRSNAPSRTGRGYQSAGSFLASGTGIGMTPGGITGSTYRKENGR